MGCVTPQMLKPSAVILYNIWGGSLHSFGNCVGVATQKQSFAEATTTCCKSKLNTSTRGCRSAGKAALACSPCLLSRHASTT
eukprot:4791351-Amphidinium_carterae.1